MTIWTWFCCCGPGQGDKKENAQIAPPCLPIIKENSEQPISQKEISEDGDRHGPIDSGRRIIRNRSISGDNRGIVVVELTKKEGCGLGLVVSGGIDKDDRPKVSYLRPGGIAHRSDALQVDDYILAVNGIRTAMLKHDEIVNLLKNAGTSVLLELEYELPEAPQSTFSVLCKRVDIQLEKDGNSFGFTLRGGYCDDAMKSRPLTVTQIRPGSSADREGTLKVGDRVLAVNSTDVARMSLVDATALLRRTKSHAHLLVEYDVSVMEAVQNATGPLLIEIDKAPGSNLGITLSTSTHHGKTVICIHSIRPASIADRCGALHIGDHILSIDDTSLEYMSVAEATQLLKCSVGEQTRLEILPMGFGKNVYHLDGRKRNSAVSSIGSTSSPSCGSLLSMATQAGSSIGYGTASGGAASPSQEGATTATVKRDPDSMTWCRREHKYSSSSASGTGTLPLPLLPNNHVCHTETHEVILVADAKGFGFELQDSVFSTDGLAEPPIMGHIEARCTAERSGVLQEGDRVIAINGQYLENKTLEEANSVLEESGAKVTLLIEFDVADSVVPSSGVFNVKLAKRGGGIGITISLPPNRQAGDSLIISDVKKGSVAHRTGTIQAGDKLLAVDNLRTSHVGVEEAAQALQEANDIVRLRIQRDDSFVEELNTVQFITYTVELHKKGGPLGITISGSEDPQEPIVISGLTTEGLADKTGALHIGDRILAINGTSLKGRPLSDAIYLLQSSGETVTLKITRPNPETSLNRTGQRRETGIEGSPDGDKHSTPIQSVDSALESWDSSRSGMESNSNKSNNGQAAGGTHSKPEATQIQGNIASLSSSTYRTVDFTQSHQQDHRTVPQRGIAEEPEDTEEFPDPPEPLKPPVAPKPSFCNSHSCRLSHHTHNQVPQESSGGSKSNPNLLSSAKEEKDSYHGTGIPHVHTFHSFHGYTSTSTAPPGDLHEHDDKRDSAFSDTHYHSNPDIGVGGDHADVFVPLTAHSINKQTTPTTQQQPSTGQFLSPDVCVSKASTPDPTIAKDAAAPSPTPSGNHLRVPPVAFPSNPQDWIDENNQEPASPSSSPTFSDDQDYWSKNMDALETLSQASDLVVHSDTTSLASSFNAASLSSRQIRSYTTDSIPDQHPYMNSQNLNDIDFNNHGRNSVGSSGGKATPEFHLREVEEQLQNIFTPTPMELYRVTLFKIREHGGFGFCLSDGVYEKGVYVSAVQPHGPAERSGVIKPYDRILQVNSIRTKDLDCSQVVPLIAKSGNYIELVISRNPLAGQDGNLPPISLAGSEIWQQIPDQSQSHLPTATQVQVDMHHHPYNTYHPKSTSQPQLKLTSKTV